MHAVCVQTIYVPELSKAIDFYTRALGYEVGERYGDSIAQLLTDGMTLILQQIPDDAPPVLARPATVLAFQTDDIEQSMREVTAAGGQLLQSEPQPCPVGLYVSFTDASGVLHELLEFRH